MLIVLLGHSFEPLLQSIIAYAPKKLLVVFATRYDQVEGEVNGEHQHKTFRSLVQDARLAELLHPLSPPEVIDPPGSTRSDRLGWDDAVSVFRYLREEVIPRLRGQDPEWCARHCTIDITGAKKNMVSGAYLFAAFAGIPVSYVDFDLYDADFQRPYGFSCRIGELESPAEGFQLDAWQRVRRHYEHAAYNLMEAELKEIRAAMRRRRGKPTESVLETIKPLFKADEAEAVKRLQLMACCYARWAEGDFRGAMAAWCKAKKAGIDEQKSGELLPTAVVELWRLWPKRVGTVQMKTNAGEERCKLPDDLVYLETGKQTDDQHIVCDLSKSLFGKPEEFVLYAQDELEKIRRLIRHGDDFRSALLRAAGLNEVLMKFRLAQAWLQGKVRAKPAEHDPSNQATGFLERTALQAQAPHAEKALFEKLMGWHLTEYTAKKSFKRNKWCFEIVEDLAITPPEEAIRPDCLAMARNKAIHFTVPVAKTLADKALHLVEWAVERLTDDLSDNAENKPAFTPAWDTPESRPGVDPWLAAFTPAWDTLCDACGIDFLPPTEDRD